ncbi:PAN/Apple domain-containing protein [Sphingomonas colocasiae]|uniref:Apple domain-containing protein n=1 Tax=Sphingomonas colocasiae TaxID=1848973 RepID=A0ABS7PUY4_9SPHN|nr:PAN/Apple domain-containing protein [Sphingomonas colocasiae]MBY8825159.1 hypothetical protein [Sphingomonas colocasiae]
MTRKYRVMAVLAALGVCGVAGMSAIGQARPAAPGGKPGVNWQTMHNTDLFGGDYREIVYDRPGSTWQQCMATCEADRQCKAFTYVLPGRQPHGECFLKGGVPEPSTSECCVSGVKTMSAASGGTRGAHRRDD